MPRNAADCSWLASNPGGQPGAERARYVAAAERAYGRNRGSCPPPGQVSRASRRLHAWRPRSHGYAYIVGRASREKAERRKAGRTRPNLLALLAENVQFLQASATSYDAGFDAEAKRLAVVLRVLLHDTNSSKSVLGQLGVKDKLRFEDTAEHINPKNLIVSAPGLVIMKFDPQRGGQYVPPLDEKLPGHIHPPVPFKPWWNLEILRDQESAAWSRRSLVLTLANKEGGAHVDPSLTPAYDSLARMNGLDYHSGNDDALIPFAGSVIAASVRQIAHEVIRTLEKAKID